MNNKGPCPRCNKKSTGSIVGGILKKKPLQTVKEALKCGGKMKKK